MSDRLLTWTIRHLLRAARGLARLQLRIREDAVDAPFDPEASARIDASLVLLEELGG